MPPGAVPREQPAQAPLADRRVRCHDGNCRGYLHRETFHRCAAVRLDRGDAMAQIVKALFQDEEAAKTTIAVGGTLVAAIAFVVVMVAIFFFR